MAAAIALAVTGEFCMSDAVAGEAATGDDKHLLFFFGTDTWRDGLFTHGGALWAPRGLDQDGFVIKASGGGGAYRYFSDFLGSNVIGRMASGSLLAGWRYTREHLVVTAYAGVEMQYHALAPDDPAASLRGRFTGVKTGFELWYEPLASAMVSADAFVTTIGPSYSANLRAGWKLFDRLYAGPEVSGFAFDDNYRQYRAGLHLTALKTGRYEWSAGGGWATDTDQRQSAYGRIGMNMRY